ncbi:hypothetical protein BH23GEM6_BH23GEM6_25940 [soil metagenome]
MDAPRRDSEIKARVRPRERELVRAAARMAGITPSELMRAATVAEAKKLLAAGVS